MTNIVLGYQSNYLGRKIGLGGLILFGLILSCATGCSTTSHDTVPPSEIDPVEIEEEDEEETKVEGVDYFLPHIDLSHWKVTLPIGKPVEVKPPSVQSYATNDVIAPFMYNDSTEGALVFYTYPGATTSNSKYSRTELREQLVPGSDKTNWTFVQGGKLKGTLRMVEMDKDVDGKYYRSIIMQIHGRLTDEQRDLIGEDDNNAPPILKIYWNNGRVRVHRKILKDVEVNDVDILKTSAWTDEAVWLGDNVDFEKFTLEIIASDGRLEVVLNDTERVVWDDIHMQKWSVFENYFKAGNYFQSQDEGTSCKVAYYDLTVSH